MSLAIWQAARIGIARTAGENAGLSDYQPAAPIWRQVISRRPRNPFDVGDVCSGFLTTLSGRLRFERAVQLRPRDYYLC